MTGFSTCAAAGGGSLQAYSILRTQDLDEARARVATVFSPHDLRISRRDHALDTQMCHVPLGGVSINRLRYGATVDIDVGRTERFLLVMMPLAGCADVRCGDVQVRSTPDTATVISPTLPLRLRSEHDADQIMVRIEREAIERHCAQHLGHELRAPLEFQVGMALRAGGGASWRGLIGYLVSELDRETNVFSSPLTRAHVEQLVISTLLLAQPHRYRDALARPVRPIAPSFVRRVEDYIVDCADQPLSIGDLAARAGVSASTLFAGFREHRGTSPMAHLRRVRMERVHQALRAAHAGQTTVTDEAVRWGFTHLGRFAADYKRWYGESPSDTLRRAGD